MIPAFFITQAAAFAGLAILRPAGRTVSEMSGEKHADARIGSSRILRSPGMLLLFTGMLLCYLSYTAINNFQINIVESVGGGSSELGVSAFIASFAEVPIISAFIPLSRRFSFRTLFKVSCLFFFVRAVLTMIVPSVPFLYAVQTLQIMSHGLFTPASAYYINDLVGKDNMAEGQTLLGIFSFGLSGLVSNLLSGVMLDHFNVRSLMMILSVLAICGYILVSAAMRRIQRMTVDAVEERR